MTDDDGLGGAGAAVVAVRGLDPQHERVVQRRGHEDDAADDHGGDQGLEGPAAAVDGEADGGVDGGQRQRDPQPAVEREGDREDGGDQHERRQLPAPAGVPPEPGQDEERQVQREVVAPGVRVGERRRRARLHVAQEVAGRRQRRVDQGADEVGRRQLPREHAAPSATGTPASGPARPARRSRSVTTNIQPSSRTIRSVDTCGRCWRRRASRS